MFLRGGFSLFWSVVHPPNSKSAFPRSSHNYLLGVPRNSFLLIETIMNFSRKIRKGADFIRDATVAFPKSIRRPLPLFHVETDGDVKHLVGFLSLNWGVLSDIG